MGEHNRNGRVEEIAMRKAMSQATNPQQPGPVDIFRSYFGLSIPDALAMLPEVVPCLCGCPGRLKVQLNVAMHHTVRGPELTTRQTPLVAPDVTVIEPEPIS
jgi:hypothetical protein